MDEQQFEHLRRSRQRRGPARLTDPSARYPGRLPPVAAILERTARRLRRRKAVIAAWRRIAEPSWLEDARVESVQRDTVVIAVASSVLLGRLRPRTDEFQQRLSRMVDGVRRVRLVLKSQA